MNAKKRFVIICQMMLVCFLGKEVYSTDWAHILALFPDDLYIVICRFVCAIFMHISLSDELEQSFKMMSYSLNHPWKFTNWFKAFRIGLEQMIIVISLEVVNLSFMLT